MSVVVDVFGCHVNIVVDDTVIDDIGVAVVVGVVHKWCFGVKSGHLSYLS